MDQAAPFRLCGTFSFTSGGQKTLRLMYEQGVSGVLAGSSVLADGDAASGQRDIKWEVYPINQVTPAPFIRGSVVSGTSGQLRVEQGFYTLGSNNFTETTGDWAGTCTRSGTNNTRKTCTINAGVFSQTPLCYANGDEISSVKTTLGSQTQVVVDTYILSGPFDSNFNLLCIGPR